jgi:hypothetical protein
MRGCEKQRAARVLQPRVERERREKNASALPSALHGLTSCWRCMLNRPAATAKAAPARAAFRMRLPRRLTWAATRDGRGGFFVSAVPCCRALMRARAASSSPLRRARRASSDMAVCVGCVRARRRCAGLLHVSTGHARGLAVVRRGVFSCLSSFSSSAGRGGRRAHTNPEAEPTHARPAHITGSAHTQAHPRRAQKKNGRQRRRRRFGADPHARRWRGLPARRPAAGRPPSPRGPGARSPAQPPR